MDAAGAALTSASTLAEEDVARAHLYRLLARLLSAPPNASTLAAMAQITGDASQLGAALAHLASTCATTGATAVTDDYNALFIGLGRGELVPYGSYYIAGFLHEKPLARLRQDMDKLGLARAEEMCEPEDHIASELELMAGFIDGGHGVPLTAKRQAAFFATHMEPWASHLFADMERSRTSQVYAAVGTVGRLFMEIETEAFAMA